jgi:hypothetical protein
MSTAGRTKEQRNGLKDVPRHVGETIEASVTAPPSRAETALDVALIGAALLEVVSPPVAAAGIALNRIAHVAR